MAPQLRYDGLEGHRAESSHGTCGVSFEDTEPLYMTFAAEPRAHYGKLPVPDHHGSRDRGPAKTPAGCSVSARSTRPEAGSGSCAPVRCSQEEIPPCYGRAY